VAGHGGRESTTGAVGRIRSLTVRFENFLFDSSLGLEAQEVDGFSMCPPVTTTDSAPISWSLMAAALIWTVLVTGRSVKAAASSTFGVTTVARGSNCSASTFRPAGSRRSVPDEAWKIGPGLRSARF